LNNRSEKTNQLLFFELDLESVVSQKEKMFKRLIQRRPGSNINLPTLIGTDLNDLPAVKAQLQKVIQTRDGSGGRVIFLVEAVLMYLDQTKVFSLLELCVREATAQNNSVSFIFADRLPNVKVDEENPEKEKAEGYQILEALGLRVMDWMIKPGRARHMGVCHSSITERSDDL